MRTFAPSLPYAQRVKAKITELLDPETISDADLAGMVAQYLITTRPFAPFSAAQFAIDHNVRVEKGPKTGACPLRYTHVQGNRVAHQFVHPEAAKPWIIAALCHGYCVSRVEGTWEDTLGDLASLRSRMKRIQDRVLHPTGRPLVDDEIPF